VTWGKAHSDLTFWLSQEGRPWFNADELDTALTQAQMDWFRSLLSRAETDAESREAIGRLITTATGKGTVAEVKGELNRVVSMEARFGDSDELVPVRPVSLDALRAIRRNPFSRATDEHPMYVTKEDGGEVLFQIQSESTPTFWRINYVGTLPVPQGESNPESEWTGVSPVHQQQIIQQAVKWLLHQEDNTPAWQRQTQTAN